MISNNALEHSCNLWELYMDSQNTIGSFFHITLTFPLGALEHTRKIKPDADAETIISKETSPFHYSHFTSRLRGWKKITWKYRMRFPLCRNVFYDFFFHSDPPLRSAHALSLCERDEIGSSNFSALVLWLDLLYGSEMRPVWERLASTSASGCPKVYRRTWTLRQRVKKSLWKYYK